MTESDVRWRSIGALFAASGAIGLVSLVLPLSPGTHVGPLAVIGAIAIVAGVAMIAIAEVMPQSDGWLSAALAGATALVTVAVILNGVAASPYALFYVWVGFDAFFFFSGRVAFAHALLASACYAIALATTKADGDARAARWLLTVGTMLVVGTLADLLRERSDRLIARLSDAARTDALTGLLNRRGFEQLMGDELERARRMRSSVSILIGDLDHFKVINDRFGHERGDDALRDFSRLAQESVRRIDGVARIGGEEFALVLPGTVPQGAYLLAERIRRRSRATLTSYAPGGLSISFGVASFPQHGQTAEDLVRHADQALYLAKRLGRDRSVIYSSDVAEAHEHQDAPSSEQVPAVLVLAETLDLRDTGTALHSRTVGRHAESIAIEMGFGRARVERVRLAGLLHDIGKLGVPDPILRKPGPLTEEEWVEMRKHPELGARILAGANLGDISTWVLAHHERPDGLGYPTGLTIDDIPLEARILAVADAFEAMTADRVYRAGMPVEDAVRELRRNAGTQFDIDVVEAFIEAQGRIKAAEMAGLLDA